MMLAIISNMKLCTIVILTFCYSYVYGQTELEFYQDFSNNHLFTDYTIQIKCELAILSDTIIWKELEGLPNNLKRDLERQFKSDSNHFLSCYRYLKWECGSKCQMFAVVDYHSGEVLDVLSSSLGLGFKTNSRLVIINPPSNQKMDVNYRNLYGDPVGYEFKNDRFRKIIK